jgi:hypothetical protein
MNPEKFGKTHFQRQSEFILHGHARTHEMSSFWTFSSTAIGIIFSYEPVNARATVEVQYKATWWHDMWFPFFFSLDDVQ